MNPADLFTKHLPSREKVEGLVKLFSCEYRSGRAAIAPQLRRLQVEDSENIVGKIEDEAFVDEAHAHDPSVLPHHYTAHEIDIMFPKARVEISEEDCFPDVPCRDGGRYCDM